MHLNNNRFWVAFGDIHTDTQCLPNIPELENAQGVIISGDLTNRGGKKEAENIIDQIKKFNSRVFAQIGNMDTEAAHSYLVETGINIHRRVVDLGQGVCLFGVGWSTFTPFGTPSEVSDQQLGQWLEETWPQTRGYQQVIAVIHNPPFETKTDRIQNGTAIGSKAVRNFLLKHQPQICITGHIHESKALDTLGKTRVVNPGNFGAGGYALIIETESELRLELMQALPASLKF